MNKIKKQRVGYCEIDRTFYTRAKNEMLVFEKDNQLSIFDL